MEVSTYVVTLCGCSLAKDQIFVLRIIYHTGFLGTGGCGRTSEVMAQH
jgi:hypothetical protein